MNRSQVVGCFLAVAWLASPAVAQSTPEDPSPQASLASQPSAECPITLRPDKAFVPLFPYLRRPQEDLSFW